MDIKLSYDIDIKTFKDSEIVEEIEQAIIQTLEDKFEVLDYKLDKTSIMKYTSLEELQRL